VKKITLILLINIYALSVLGYGVKGFYCCGNLKSVTFSFTQHAQKSHSTSSDKSNCCKTKYQYFKVKDNHIASDHINSPEKFFTLSNFSIPSFQPIFYANYKIIYANPCNAPPLHKGVAIHISNCTFLI